MNRHRGMELKKIWFKRGEFNKLVNAIESNENDEVFKILFEMKFRGDL